MKKALTVLGILWASPITIFGFLKILADIILGHYTFLGIRDNAFIFEFTPKVDKSFYFHLLSFWCNKDAVVYGNIIILKNVREKYIKYSCQIVKQYMTFGVFRILLSSIISFIAEYMLEHADSRFDNIFIIDARRAANQVVDVPGISKRINEMKKSKITNLRC